MAAPSRPEDAGRPANVDVQKLVWKAPAYHSVMQILHNPLYAGAYAFGRKGQRTKIEGGRACKTSGVAKPREDWNVLLRDAHPGYISWQEYEDNQQLLENAYMKKNCDRKSARGGRALRRLADHWPDREIAVSLNRMRCRTGDGETWTTVRVKEMRERLGLPEYDPTRQQGATISLMKAAERLGICVGSAMSLVRRGILPATQIIPGSPWLVPVEALASEPVRAGVQQVIARRPKNYDDYQYDKVVRLPEL